MLPLGRHQMYFVRPSTSNILGVHKCDLEKECRSWAKSSRERIEVGMYLDYQAAIFINCYSLFMKVVQIITRVNQGGTARWLETLCVGMQEQGIEVVLIAGSVQDGEIEDPFFVNFNGVRIKGLGRSVSIFQDLTAFFTLRRLIRDIDPDVVNTHTAKAGVLGRLCAFSLFGKKPLVVHTYHGHLLYGYFNSVITRLVTLIEKILGFVTDIFISSGNKVRDELIGAGVGSKKKFVVVRPGVKTIQLQSKATLRSDLSIADDAIVVGWLGRLTQIKRPDRVIELAQKLPHIIFLMGGDGDLAVSLRADCPPNVKLIGWTSPELIWSISDIALLTSENEAQPLSLVEAAGAGLPLVGENVGSVSEIFDDRKSGFLVNNLEERIDALNVLANDFELRVRMGAEAKKIAIERFGVKQFIDAHMSVYISGI